MHNIKPGRKWSATEEEVLYHVVRSRLDSLSQFEYISETNQAFHALYLEYQKRVKSNNSLVVEKERDKLAILHRLKDLRVVKIFKIKGETKYQILDLSLILKWKARTASYGQLKLLLTDPDASNDKDKLDQILEKSFSTNVLGETKCTYPVNDSIHNAIGKLTKTIENKSILQLITPLSLFFYSLDNDLIKVGNDGMPTATKQSAKIPFNEILEDKIVDQLELHSHRAQIGKHYKIDPSPAKPSFIPCNVGTGVGKSFGSLEEYVDVTVRQYPDGFKPENVGLGNFVNYVFITPQKSQINFSIKQIKKLRAKGIQLLSVLGMDDLSNPTYTDWFTGITNKELYQNIFYRLKPQANGVRELFKIIGRTITERDLLEKRKNIEEKEELLRVKKELLKSQRTFVNSLANLCREECTYLVNEGCISELVKKGLIMQYYYLASEEAEECGFKAPKRPSSDICTNREYAVFNLLRRVYPYEVAKYTPTMLGMTTSKSQVKVYTLKMKERGSGFTQKIASFEDIIGSKEPDSNKVIGKVLHKSSSEKFDFLKNDYFEIDEESYFIKHNVRFNIVIDELHDSYRELHENTFDNLISEKTHLPMVLSSAATFCKSATEIIDSGFDHNKIDEQDEDWQLKSNLVKYYLHLKDYLERDDIFSEWVNGIDFLEKYFLNNCGNFEVDGKDAESITKITNNVFSYNAKRFTNLKELKSIRISYNFYTKCSRLYFQKNGLDDKNPTLHDFYQLVIAIVAAGIEVNDKAFRTWMRQGNHISEGNHKPFSEFIGSLDSIKAEVKELLDQADENEDIEVDHLYAHYQPKITFSMRPVNELLHGGFKGKEKCIYLTFGMDLIKASPEVGFLKMLVGTRNQLLTLSATSGYANIYDGNYSRGFMSAMCQKLGIDFRERTDDNLELIEELVDKRKIFRDIEFKVPLRDDMNMLAAINKSEYDHVYNKLEDKLLKVNDSKENRVFDKVLHNPYKQIELRRQINILICSYERCENGISLAISHEFLRRLSTAVMCNKQFFQDELGTKILYEKDDQAKVISMDLYQNGNTQNVILFDGKLVKDLESDCKHNLKDFTTVADPATNVLLMSSFKSAGTGLNNVVTFLQDCGREVEEDYKNIFICGSPYFSNVLGEGGFVDTLSNQALFIKNRADNGLLRSSVATYVSDMPNSLTESVPYEILLNEHDLAILKQILQCLGRIERRDTKMLTSIYIPDDVIIHCSFELKKLVNKSRRNKDYNIYRGMSLIGKEFTSFTLKYMSERTFSDSKLREKFENMTRDDGESINTAHIGELRDVIREYRKTGDERYRRLNDLFRGTRWVTEPRIWMNDIAEAALELGMKNLAYTAPKMFIENPAGIYVCTKGSKDRFTLSDFEGSTKTYDPWEIVFPTYIKNLESQTDVFILSLFKSLQKMKSIISTSNLIPNPAIIPLLRGNIGEFVFSEVMNSLGIAPLNANEVKKLLGTQVYEKYDFYFYHNDNLYCVDVKFWSVRKQDQTITRKVRSGKNHKPESIHKAIKANQDLNPSKVVYIYANAFYGNTIFTESELNHDSTVAYLNIFDRNSYYKERSKIVYSEVGKEKRVAVRNIEQIIRINKTLEELLDITAY